MLKTSTTGCGKFATNLIGASHSMYVDSYVGAARYLFFAIYFAIYCFEGVICGRRIRG